jgi:PhnB protein
VHNEQGEMVQVQTYLFFEGRCEEALTFYKETLGAEIGPVLRFRDNPDDPARTMFPPGAGDMVMHASMKIGETTILVSDGRCSGKPGFHGMSLTVVLPQAEAAEGVFRALAGQTFFSPAFGMVTDKFGVEWMIYTAGAPAA